MFEKLVHE